MESMDCMEYIEHRDKQQQYECLFGRGCSSPYSCMLFDPTGPWLDAAGIDRGRKCLQPASVWVYVRSTYASEQSLNGSMLTDKKDINHSGDGGIYGQMLRNNGLQGNAPDLTAWASVGDGTIDVDLENPLTAAIPHTLRLDISEDATGQVGFSNAGYWGIPVDGSTFQNYFWIKGEYSGSATVRLVSQDGGEEYASSELEVLSNADEFTYVTTSFPTVKAPNGNVLYELTVDGDLVAGKSLHFGLLQLFPETYKARFVFPPPSLVLFRWIGLMSTDTTG